MIEPTDEELANMHWKDRWEYEARKEAEFQTLLSEDELLERVRQGLTDSYFAIWDSLAKVGTVSKSAPVLWQFLRDNPGENAMLDRYHCAAALFTILGTPDSECENELRRQVQWDHQGEEARQAALVRLKQVIDQKAG